MTVKGCMPIVLGDLNDRVGCSYSRWPGTQEMEEEYLGRYEEEVLYKNG